MKLELNNRLVGRLIGVSMAAAVTVSWTVTSQILKIKQQGAAVTANAENVPQSAEGAKAEPIIIPFNDENINDGLQDDSGRLYEVYSKIIKSEQGKKKPPAKGQKPETLSSMTDAVETTTTTQATTQSATASTEVSAETNATDAQSEQTVSNGKEPFNYSDVSSIAANMNELDDFVDNLNPVSFEWDTSNYAEHGCVQITLSSVGGSVTLDVKPTEQEGETDPYLIDGEISGRMNASALSYSEWYQQNKDCGCSIRSVTWLKTGFAIDTVRGIDVGTGLADLTDHYLCVNGGATTLYKAADVIANEDKLNTLLAAENAYTFVGGRLYTISGYLEKYYSGKADTYAFADCDMVVQYGCNSIVDHNYISGSWIIEYAIKDDAVTGITFMNKSYYKKREIRGGATSSSTSTSSTSVLSETIEKDSKTTEAAVETVTTAAAESGEGVSVSELTDVVTTAPDQEME